MAVLTASEVVQVLNRLHPHNAVYILDEEAGGLIYAAVKHEKREGLYTVTERMRVEDAIKRISVVLSMEIEADDAG